MEPSLFVNFQTFKLGYLFIYLFSRAPAFSLFAASTCLFSFICWPFLLTSKLFAIWAAESYSDSVMKTSGPIRRSSLSTAAY